MSRNRRLDPSPCDADYLHLRTLAAQLRRQVRRHLAGRSGIEVLDVGSGERPYESLFDGISGRYVGLDVAAGAGVDVVGSAELLPFDDGSFDCVLCTQALQYAEDPQRAVFEISRVLRDGGLALVSTHGVSHSHADPPDHWRWTQSGLALEFQRHGAWSNIEVSAGGAAGTTLAYLVGWQLQGVGAKAGLRPLFKPLILAMNIAGWWLDRVYMRIFGERPPDLCSNYVLAALRAPR